MSLILALKDEDHYILAADNVVSFGVGKHIRSNQRQYRMQRFNNFVIAFNGDHTLFQKLIQKFDFNKFPEPLTKKYLIKEFYKKFLTFLVKEEAAKVENGIIQKSEFGIIIMGKNYAFDIGDEGLYEITTFNAYGNDNLSFQLYRLLEENIKGEKLIKIMIDYSVKYCKSTEYPFLIVDSKNIFNAKLYFGKQKEEEIQLKENY